jgi:hypothetical protein
MSPNTTTYPGTPFFYTDALVDNPSQEIIKIDPALRKISSTKGKFPSNLTPPKKKRKK